MNSITDKIKALRKHQRAKKVLGADMHAFRLHLVTEKAILRFEEVFRITLPDNFRTHLMTVGSGAGPYYGIMTPDEIEEELLSPSCGHGRTCGKEYDPAKPFPISDHDIKAWIQLRQGSRTGNSLTPGIDRPYPLDGTVTICSQGCTGWTVLVVSGALAGAVWDVECSMTDSWTPAQRPNTMLDPDARGLSAGMPELDVPPSFIQWYESWLERCSMEFAGTKLHTAIGK